MKRLTLSTVLVVILLVSQAAAQVTTITVGTGTTANTTTSYPAPYGNYWWGVKQQYLVRASEIIAAGGAPGVLTSLAFDVTQVSNAASHDNFAIAVGGTSDSVLNTAAFYTGLTPVFSVAAYTETVGWNTHAFSTNYFWNGVDNLIIEVCFNNISFNVNALTTNTDVGYVSSMWFNADAAGVCAQANPSSTSANSTSRPNMQMGFLPASGRDAGLTALISPASFVTGANLLTARVQSLANDPISSVDLGYQLDNFPPVLENGVIISTPLSPGQTYNHTFLTPLNIPAAGTYTLKTWATNANGLGNDNNTSNDTLVRTICTSIAGFYTIGGSGADYVDIASAVNALTSCGISGPVTFSINPGVYYGGYTIANVLGSGGANTITFNSTTGIASDVVLVHDTSSLASTNRSHFTINTDARISFQNLKFERQVVPTVSAQGVITYGAAASGDVISCIIEDITGSTSFSNNGIIYRGEQGIFLNNTFKGFYYPLRLEGPSVNPYRSGNLISNNIFTDYTYRAIYAQNQNDVVISGNSISAFKGTSSFGAGIWTNGTYGAQVSDNNIFGEMPQHGILIANPNADTLDASVNPNRYFNNVINGTLASTITSTVVAPAPISVSASFSATSNPPNPRDAVEIVNNTISYRINTTSTSTLQGGIYVSGGSASTPAYAHMRISNNILEMGPATPSGSLPAGLAALRFTNQVQIDSAIVTTNNYRLLGATLPPLVGVNTPVATYNTLADWQAASNRDSGSATLDPLFLNTNTLVPSNAALDNRGVPVSYVQTDIAGTPRSLITPDMGAYEFPLNVMPVALFSASSYLATIGGNQSAVTLTDISSGNPTSRTWSIQHFDSSISTVNAVNFISGGINSDTLEISFNVAGGYDVALTVSNATGTDTKTVLRHFYVENALCVSRANNTVDTKIDSLLFGGVATGTALNTCETYSSYLGRSPILSSIGEPYGSSILRTTAGDTSLDYVFSGNASLNGWGNSYGDVALFSANGQVILNPMGAIGLACDSLPAGSLTGKVAVMYRGDCEFGLKAYHAQQAGALGVIIVNNQPGAPMNLGGGAMGSMVTIPVAMVDEFTGWNIINGINNNSTGYSISMGGLLNNFGSISRGMDAPISIKPGSCSGVHYPANGKVYIDWNGDYTFDADEEVFAFQSNTAFNWVNGMVSVPAAAVPGLRRMRVVYNETSNAALVQPCGTYAWGETEDYLVNITATFPGLNATLPDTLECTGLISLPVTVSNFNGVGAITMSILFDTTALSFVGISGMNSALSGGQLLSNAVGGRLGISWFDVNGASSSSDTLFFLDFDAQAYTDLNWDVTPGLNEFADTLGNVLMAIFNNGTYTPRNNCNEILGALRYDNGSQTPMSNSTVLLMQQGSVLQSANTDAAGNFNFIGFPNGAYELTATTNKPWGGVNATDALSIARHFTGASPLLGRRLTVADLNGSNSVNATDALTVALRFTGQQSSFSVGDWYFDVLPVQMTGSPQAATIFGLAYGDVNGSYNPSQVRVAPQMFVVKQGVVMLGREEQRIPIRMNESKEVGAISMELSVPEGVQVHRVTTRLEGGSFNYMLDGQTLRISWYSLNEQAVAIDQTIFELHASALSDGVKGDWVISGLSEMANGWAEPYISSGIRIPSVQGLSTLFDARLFPNPTTDISQLSIQAPESGLITIRVVDALGKTVMLQEGIKVEAGVMNIQLDAAAWGAGRYQATVLYEAAEGMQMKQLKLQVIR